MASGDTLAFWPAISSEAPSSNFALLGTRNLHPILKFDASTNWSAIFRGKMPQHYAGGGVDVYLVFTMATAITGDVDWDIAFELIGTSLDIDADSFAAVNSVDNTTVPGTSGVPGEVSRSFTDGADMDSVVAGAMYRVKVTRDAASDTAAGNAELLGVEIRES